MMTHVASTALSETHVVIQHDLVDAANYDYYVTCEVQEMPGGK